MTKRLCFFLAFLLTLISGLLLIAPLPRPEGSITSAETACYFLNAPANLLRWRFIFAMESLGSSLRSLEGLVFLISSHVQLVFLSLVFIFWFVFFRQLRAVTTSVVAIVLTEVVIAALVIGLVVEAYALFRFHSYVRGTGYFAWSLILAGLGVWRANCYRHKQLTSQQESRAKGSS